MDSRRRLAEHTAPRPAATGHRVRLAARASPPLRLAPPAALQIARRVPGARSQRARRLQGVALHPDLLARFILPAPTTRPPDRTRPTLGRIFGGGGWGTPRRVARPAPSHHSHD